MADTALDTIEPTFFETITQYDQSFDPLWLANPEVKKGLACPYFCIFTAESFMNGGDVSREDYERDLETSINANILMGTNDEMTFEELVGYTSLNKKDIGCTVAQLIQSGEYDLKDLFKSEKETYCVMFLKNAKFFVVLCNDEGFHIRDAHESVQYTYYSVDQLIDRLNTVYQFNSAINIGGVAYDDYSSIEFIKIEEKFQNTLRDLISAKLEHQEGETELIQNVKMVDEKEDSMVQAAIAASLGIEGGNNSFPEFDMSKLVDVDPNSMIDIDLESDGDDAVSDIELDDN